MTKITWRDFIKLAGVNAVNLSDWPSEPFSKAQTYPNSPNTMVSKDDQVPAITCRICPTGCG